MTGNSKGRNLQTIERTSEIISLVKKSDGIRVSDVVEEFDIAKSTAHGYLSTLDNVGILKKSKTGYVLGLRLLHLGEQARSRNDRYELAKSYVKELADELTEGADFMVDENDKLYTIYNDVASLEDPNFRTGNRFHLHNSAGGKAVLAEKPPERAKEIIDRVSLPKTTRDTITDPNQLLAEIAEVRQRGFAITEEELIEGLTSIGVAVTHPDGSVFGAFGIGGPTYRIDEDRINNQISNRLIDTKQAFERDLEQ